MMRIYLMPPNLGLIRLVQNQSQLPTLGMYVVHVPCTGCLSDWFHQAEGVDFCPMLTMCIQCQDAAVIQDALTDRCDMLSS